MVFACLCQVLTDGCLSGKSKRSKKEKSGEELSATNRCRADVANIVHANIYANISSELSCDRSISVAGEFHGCAPMQGFNIMCACSVMSTRATARRRMALIQTWQP